MSENYQTKKVDEYLKKLPKEPDPDIGRYTMVLYGLLKQYDIKSPLEILVFSQIENLSRKKLCTLKLDALAAYSGGSEAEVEEVLMKLERNEIIERGTLKTTDGWRLTDEVRRYAKDIKANIRFRRYDSKE